MINLENYDLYIIDYLDEKLNSDEISELFAFFLLHPEKKEEFHELNGFILSPDKQLFKGKQKLKKNLNDIHEINEYNFEEICIAKLEGDLPLSKHNLYHQFLKNNPGKQLIEATFKRTFLTPDTAITYPGKSGLKRLSGKSVLNKVFLYASSVAAIALVVFGILNIVTYEGGQPDVTNVSEIEQQPPKVDRIPNETEGVHVADREGAASTQPNKGAHSEASKIAQSKTSLSPAGNDIASEQEIEYKMEIIQLEKLAAIQPEMAGAVITYDMNIKKHTSYGHKPSKKSTSYATFPKLALEKIKQKVHTLPADSLITETLPELAETSLQKLYAVLEKEINIEKKTTNEGKTKSISFNTRYFGFYTTRTKN